MGDTEIPDDGENLSVDHPDKLGSAQSPGVRPEDVGDVDEQAGTDAFPYRHDDVSLTPQWHEMMIEMADIMLRHEKDCVCTYCEEIRIEQGEPTLATRVCRNCEMTVPPPGKRTCLTCQSYRKRNGKDRPRELIEEASRARARKKY